VKKNTNSLFQKKQKWQSENNKMQMTTKEKKAEQKFFNMLSYKRPEGDIYQKIFCERFLKPLMGDPDLHGNYICKVTTKGEIETDPDLFVYSLPDNIVFMAHHDTVHRQGGIQKLEIFTAKQGNRTFRAVGAVDSNCLGADCTTGCWLILEMIKAKVPGIYIIHAGEEIGGVGSSGLVKDQPAWLNQVNFAISFDRKGISEIITHQLDGRSCSNEFAHDLGKILGLGMLPSTGGTYTDSAEYIYDVAECTNISVGYYGQHTKDEIQDLDYLVLLRRALVNADWSKLKPYKSVEEEWKAFESNFRSRFDEDYYYSSSKDWDKYLNQKYSPAKPRKMRDLILDNADALVDILMQYDYDYELLEQEIRANSYGIPF
jgi:hypothetical protein